MATRIQVLSHFAGSTTINQGCISASKKTVVQQLPPIPNGRYRRDFAVVSGRDESRVYELTLWKRREGCPKETIGGAGLLRFINDYGLGVGDRIILYKEPGVNRLANALITADSYILDFSNGSGR